MTAPGLTGEAFDGEQAEAPFHRAYPIPVGTEAVVRRRIGRGPGDSQAGDGARLELVCWIRNPGVRLRRRRECVVYCTATDDAALAGTGIFPA